MLFLLWDYFSEKEIIPDARIRLSFFTSYDSVLRQYTSRRALITMTLPRRHAQRLTCRECVALLPLSLLPLRPGKDVHAVTCTFWIFSTRVSNCEDRQTSRHNMAGGLERLPKALARCVIPAGPLRHEEEAPELKRPGKVTEWGVMATKPRRHKACCATGAKRHRQKTQGDAREAALQ